MNLVMIALLYFIFGRVLDPLQGLAAGLAHLERRNYQVRLPRPRPRELAELGDRFNALAAALEVARAQNAELADLGGIGRGECQLGRAGGVA